MKGKVSADQLPPFIFSLDSNLCWSGGMGIVSGVVTQTECTYVVTLCLSCCVSCNNSNFYYHIAQFSWLHRNGVYGLKIINRFTNIKWYLVCMEKCVKRSIKKRKTGQKCGQPFCPSSEKRKVKRDSKWKKVKIWMKSANTANYKYE